jgi:putative ABC transport system substrate-binding protein
MRRREFISLVGGATASPLVARAEQSAKMKRIAMVHTYEAARDMIASYHPFYGAFFNELSRAGYIEGKNLDVERYSADGRPERYDELVRNVLDTRPDAIYALDGALTVLFKASTTTIPILAISNDPVAEGLVPNIARPGGNITGVSIDLGSEIWGKRIGVLKEALPKISNVGVIALSAKVWETVSGMAARQAAKSASISMTVVALDEEANVAAYQRVFAAIEQKRLDAIVVSETPVHVISPGDA